MTKKTRHHRLAVSEGIEARKALNRAYSMLDSRYNDDGSLLLPAEQLEKAQAASVWLQKAENHVAMLRSALLREIDYRTNEADPDVIRQRVAEQRLKELNRHKTLKRTDDELRDDILRLSNELRLVPAAIADTIGVPEFRVRRILKETRAA